MRNRKTHNLNKTKRKVSVNVMHFSTLLFVVVFVTLTFSFWNKKIKKSKKSMLSKRSRIFLQTLKRLFIFRLHAQLYTLYFLKKLLSNIVSYVLTYDDLRIREWASQFSLILNFFFFFYSFFSMKQTMCVCGEEWGGQEWKK